MTNVDPRDIIMSISAENWKEACETLRHAWNESSDTSTGWSDVKFMNDPLSTEWIRIIKIAGYTVPPTAENAEEESQVEIDDEALQRNVSTNTRDRICYDLILSPTYGVPVLYITFPARPVPGADEIYAALLSTTEHPLVPPMQSIGPLGALSMTDHPVLGLPTYFVHPCRTADAMDAVTGGQELSCGAYLLAWMGLIGGGVGLDVPVGVAQYLAKTTNSPGTR
ncbi:Hypothetical protein R9X50_00440200 [Acrodontium crateriforme]|uniref:Ubiquitin-like-conjugating enzyme ATG10 n=1 Tax=Acrodontium crateriforme TaxID=150365 RepID=A0AAQ3M5A5_9PEZI|nr:Hypothetical protein R9X50_00440200 [Acrodontium crateriforme]